MFTSTSAGLIGGASACNWKLAKFHKIDRLHLREILQRSRRIVFVLESTGTYSLFFVQDRSIACSFVLHPLLESSKLKAQSSIWALRFCDSHFDAVRTPLNWLMCYSLLCELIIFACPIALYVNVAMCSTCSSSTIGIWRIFQTIRC